MAKYADLPLKKYLCDLSARTPAPGGGSAAALAASAGIALLEMVANYTLGKRGYEKYDGRIREVLFKLRPASVKAQAAIDEDVKIYGLISSASMAASSVSSSSAKAKKRMQKLLEKSFLLQTEIMNTCAAAVAIAAILAKIGNKNLQSDVYCGLSMLRAGIESSKFNIDINLKYMDDSSLKRKNSAGYSRIFESARRRIDRIMEKHDC